LDGPTLPLLQKKENTMPIPTEASADASRREANKALVRDFYDKVVNQSDFVGASRYLGDTYIQHRADCTDGVDGLRTFMHRRHTERPLSHVDLKRVIAEDDLVVLHVHVVPVPGHRGSSHVDIFRVESGKVVEHWDIDQPIPENTLNKNGPF
jgi:predicted SnoaL-like aldol condensation-catalyzing enzyme